MEKTIGIVIKCKDYRETSQLVWLYTRDFGKVKVIAKASRANVKRFKGKIDLFNHCEIVFYKNPRNELHLLNECDILEPFSRIRLDLHKFAVASYIVELTEACTGLEDPNKEIYDLLSNVLKWLEDGKEPDFIRCVFELKLLKYSGSLPKIDNVTKGVKAIIHRILEYRAIDKLRILAAQLEELKGVLRLIIDYSVGKRLKSLGFLEEISHGKK